MKNEAELQRRCNDLLRRMDIPFYHKEKGRTVSKSHSRGFPDLVIFYRGRVVFVELKHGDGKQSPEQVEFQKTASAHYFDYHLVYTFESFVSIVNSIIRQA